MRDAETTKVKAHRPSRGASAARSGGSTQGMTQGQRRRKGRVPRIPRPRSHLPVVEIRGKKAMPKRRFSLFYDDSRRRGNARMWGPGHLASRVPAGAALLARRRRPKRLPTLNDTHGQRHGHSDRSDASARQRARAAARLAPWNLLRGSCACRCRCPRTRGIADPPRSSSSPA